MFPRIAGIRTSNILHSIIELVWTRANSSLFKCPELVMKQMTARLTIVKSSIEKMRALVITRASCAYYVTELKA